MTAEKVPLPEPGAPRNRIREGRGGEGNTEEDGLVVEEKKEAGEEEKGVCLQADAMGMANRFMDISMLTACLHRKTAMVEIGIFQRQHHWRSDRTEKKTRKDDRTEKNKL